MQHLFDESGRTVSIGAKLGEGGEGSVYRLANKPSLAVKVYSKRISGEQVEKIRILSGIRDSTLDRFTSWPEGLVFEKSGLPRGFLLPVIEAGQDVHQLYTPSSRRQYFPDADWRFIVHVAINISRAFAAVHHHRLVIGDVNPRSVLVLADGTVRLIDIDSFQVQDRAGRYLLCTVAMPHFLPPELQGGPLSSIVRTQNHDGFGLAVTLFQLLLLGRHPYAGRYLQPGEMPIERAIAENRFAYSIDAAKRAMDRPPNTVGLEVLPSSLGALFEAAFSQDSTSNGRPSAIAWISALDSLAGALKRCTQSDRHYYFKQLTACPWCSIEANVNVALFGVSTLSSHSPQTFELQFEELLAQARAATPKPATVATTAMQPVPAKEAVAASMMPQAGWIAGGVGIVLAAVALLLLNRVAGIPVLALGASSMLLGFSAKRIRQRRWRRDFKRARAQYRIAQERLDFLNTFPGHAQAARKFDEVTLRWRQLPADGRERYRKLELSKQDLQRRQYLEAQSIASATIKGIGSTLVTMLSSYGIDTALDITERRVLQVPGIGPKRAQALIAWQQARARAFTFDPSLPLPREAIVRLESELEKERLQVLGDLRAALARLRHAADSDQHLVTEAARRASETALSLNQAEVDVRAATGGVRN